MKCWNCYKKHRHVAYNYEYCSRCGLYLESFNLEKQKAAVDLLEKMLVRWGYEKRVYFYKIREDNGYVFKYIGIKKIIENIFIIDDITIAELNALIQIISYLSFGFEMNITELAIRLFWFAQDFFNSHQNHLAYWVKRGLKEKSRSAYEYLLYELYYKDSLTKKGKRKKEKIRQILRSLPN